MGTGALLGTIICIDYNFIDNLLANRAAIGSSRLVAQCSCFDILVVEEWDSFVPWFVQSTVTARRA
jgi:hypothetical protein